LFCFRTGLYGPPPSCYFALPSSFVTFVIFSFLLHSDFFLEDALEATGFQVGRASKWAKRSGGGKARDGGDDASGGGGDCGGGPAGYSEQTRISLANIDEGLVNTDLIEQLVAHLLASRQGGGGSGGGKKGGRGGGDDASAILVFAPGEGGADAGMWRKSPPSCPLRLGDSTHTIACLAWHLG
jgi:hypothetical protein